jgi:hypothetical protein
MTPQRPEAGRRGENSFLYHIAEPEISGYD